MRIYRLMVVAFFTLSIIFVSNYGGNVPYAVLYLSILLPIASLVYTLYVYSKFRIFQSIDRKTIVKGELVPYRYTVSNEDKITFRSIQVKFFDDRSQVVGANAVQEYTLLPGECIELQTNLLCNYRGVYEVGVNNVVITDFLRIMSITYPLRSKYKVTVLPRVLNLTKLRILPTEMDSKRTQVTINPEEIERDSEVRNYVRGDSMKLIHWKATARQHSLQTRKTTQNPRQEINLYLDLYQVKETEMDRIALEDKMIEAVLALAKYCQANSIPVRICYQQNTLQEQRVNTLYEFDKFYNICANIKFNEKIMMGTIIESAATSCGMSIVLIHMIDDFLCLELKRLVQRGLEVIVLYFANEETQDTKSKINTLRNMGIHTIVIMKDDELIDIL